MDFQNAAHMGVYILYLLSCLSMHEGKSLYLHKTSIINCLNVNMKVSKLSFPRLFRGEKLSPCTSFLLAQCFGYSSCISKAVLVYGKESEWTFLSHKAFAFLSGLLATFCWPALWEDARFQLHVLQHVLPNDQCFSLSTADKERLCHPSWHTLALLNDIGCCCARHKFSHAFS